MSFHDVPYYNLKSISYRKFLTFSFRDISSKNIILDRLLGGEHMPRRATELTPIQIKRLLHSGGDRPDKIAWAASLG
jgi:hypothetical protein